MLWTISDKDSKLVIDGTGRTICFTDNDRIASQIVKDHNQVYQAGQTWTGEQIDAMHDEKSNVKR
jgi:hypothetical protein